jgi:tetratricopeptide (TPR) repeat protein
MGKPSFDSLVVQTMPTLRELSVLVDEISDVASGKSADIARAALAEIELAISQAEADYGNGTFGAALTGFRRARGLVFRLLHPRFDVSQWLRDRSAALLPGGTEIEASLLTAAARLIAALQPEASDASGLPPLAAGDVGKDLARFSTTGFRKAAGGDDRLEVVAFQALALMNDGKPGLAATAMQEALESAASARVSPHTVASTHLNLATALLQAGSPEQARAEASAAEAGFRKLKDQLGAAQALHAEGVAASIAGDTQAAEQLFDAAQKMLGVAPEQPGATGPGERVRAGANAGTPIAAGPAAGRVTGPAIRRVAAGWAVRGDVTAPAAAEVAGLDGWSPEVLDPIWATLNPTAVATAVPEPSSWCLFLTGAALSALVVWRRRCVSLGRRPATAVLALANHASVS